MGGVAAGSGMKFLSGVRQWKSLREIRRWEFIEGIINWEGQRAELYYIRRTSIRRVCVCVCVRRRMGKKGLH